MITAAVATVVGGLPNILGWGARFKLAGLRALKTFLQGVVAALPASGAGQAILGTTYWKTFGYSVLAAAIAGAASFIQNMANFLPDDPTVHTPPQPAGPPNA